MIDVIVYNIHQQQQKIDAIDVCKTPLTISFTIDVIVYNIQQQQQKIDVVHLLYLMTIMASVVALNTKSEGDSIDHDVHLFSRNSIFFLSTSKTRYKSCKTNLSNLNYIQTLIFFLIRLISMKIIAKRPRVF